METDLYEEFDNLVANSTISDEYLENLLSKFTHDDFLDSPIIFDLIVNKRIKILEKLYQQGIPFSYTYTSGANALHIASAIDGSLEAVKFLTERKIFTDINDPSDVTETPFLLAVMYDHVDIIEYFLENYTPDFTIKSYYGDTIFSLAKNSDNGIEEILLEYLKKNPSPFF